MLIAFAQSCNTPFAQDRHRPRRRQRSSPTATSYGLNNPAALDVPGVTVAPSNFTAEPDKSFTAFDAIGQHDTTVTPMQEAMFAATVANNGVLMKPYLIQQVTANHLSVVQQTQPQQLSKPISPTVAGDEKKHDDRRGAGQRGHLPQVQRQQRAEPDHRWQDRYRTEWQRKRHSRTPFSPLSHRLTTRR